MRVRQTITNKLHICVPIPHKCDKPATFLSVKEMFIHRRGELEDFERRVMQEADLRTSFHPYKDWFVDLNCWNTLERNLQEINPLAQVEALCIQLKWCENSEAQIETIPILPILPVNM